MFEPSPALCPELVSLNRFPLVSPLSSTLSAHCSALQHLFEGFIGTIGLSDFPQPFIAVVLLRFTTRTSHCHMLRPVHGISSPRRRLYDKMRKKVSFEVIPHLCYSFLAIRKKLTQRKETHERT
jgi:hypothetical protein